MNANELSLLDHMLTRMHYDIKDDPDVFSPEDMVAYTSLCEKHRKHLLGDPEGPILGFDGEYRWLSNFWKAEQVLDIWTGDGEQGDRIVFNSNEQWYMVNKTTVPEEAQAILAAATPGDCKRIGKTVTLRSDWEQVKDQVMLDGLRMKFGQHADLRAKLIATGTRYLEETNTWKDTYWGVCNGVGRNMLGILLMQVRAELSVT